MSHRGFALRVLPVLSILVASCSGVTVESTSSQPPSSMPSAPVKSFRPSGAVGSVGALPQFSHVYLIVLENEAYDSLVGNGQAPYLRGLISDYGLATNYYAVAHPSQPNYLALFSGSTQGVTDDSPHSLNRTNLVDQLEARGKSWSVFAQDYPGDCFTGTTNMGSGDGWGAAGSYARKHNPPVSFLDITSNPARCGRIHDLSSFDPAAADFELIVPNQCNDMHSCPIITGDDFLRTFVPQITSSQAFAGSVLFITTDEGSSDQGSSDQGGGGHVMTLVIGSMVKPGFRSTIQHDHYSLLRTIEDSWGLGCLGQSCSANNMAEFFA